MTARIGLVALILAGCKGDPTPDTGGSDTDTDADVDLEVGDALVPLDGIRPQGAGPPHILDVAIEGDRGFSATSAGVFVYDLADPGDLAQIGTSGAGTRSLFFLELDGSDGVITGRDFGAARFQVDDEGGMSAVAINRDLNAEGVALTPSHVVVASGPDGVLVLDRSDLSPVGSYPASNAIDVVVAGDVAWVGDRVDGLVALDLSDPGAPTALGDTPLSGSIQGLAIDGDVLYAANSGFIDLVDVSDPSAPAVISSIRGGGVASRVAIDNGFLAVANYVDTRLYDVTDPADPTLLAVEDAGDISLGVAFVGDLLVVGDWNDFRTFRVDTTLHSPEIDFPERIEVPAGDTAPSAVVIDNLGELPLSITDVACDADITPSITTLELDPGAVGVLELTVDTADKVDWTGHCTLSSNDVDEPEAELAVVVNPAGLAVGDEAPPFTEPALDGTWYSLSDFGGSIVMLTLFSSS